MLLISSVAFGAVDVEKRYPTVPEGEELRPGLFDSFTNLPRDWATWGKRSFRSENLPVIGATLGVSVLFYKYDYELWQMFKRQYDKHPFYHDVADGGVFMGDGGPQFGIAGAFALYGWMGKSDRALRTSSQIVEVILSTGLVIQTLKHLTGRESPSAVSDCKVGCWHGPVSFKKYFGHVSKYDAVPSGHIATSLATLQVVIENYPEETWLKYVGYPAIGVIGVGLVSTSIHWWSDIPFGLLIGYSFSQVVTHADPVKPHLALVSSTASDPGLGISWKF